MSTVPPKLSEVQYLEIERKAEFKSEFFRGEMFAMSGANRQHNRISVNLIRYLSQRLNAGPCDVLGSDMRIRVSKTGLYTYPDLSIVCVRPQFADDRTDTLLNPKVLFEILSDSTEKYDRGFKFENYRQLDSMQEFVIVSQTEPLVEVFQRLPDGDWLLREARALEESITLHSIGITLPLSEIYLRVEFPGPDTTVD